MKIACDLHIHSCLSPCGEDEMTPNNIVNMAALSGLNAIALTDHNACGNCRAAYEVAKREYPEMLVLSGMELTTAEEIHVLCLFAFPDEAERFEKTVRARQLQIANKPDFFGHQYLMDANDGICGEYPNLLITATDISISEAASLAAENGGVAVAAHVDKSSNSVLANLGFMDPEWGFSAIEISKNFFRQNMTEFLENNGLLMYNVLMDSDAHTLGDIAAAEGSLEVAEFSAQSVIERIKRR